MVNTEIINIHMTRWPFIHPLSGCPQRQITVIKLLRKFIMLTTAVTPWQHKPTVPNGHGDYHEG